MSDLITPLSSVLTIIKANDDEKMYIMQVGAATSSASNDPTPDADDNQEDDTAVVQDGGGEDDGGTEPDNSSVDSGDIINIMMTGILNGNEKYIRYFKGEIMTIYDNSLISSGWAPDDVCKTPRFVQKLNAIRDFIKSGGHPL
jgi:hypothetical protein